MDLSKLRNVDSSDVPYIVIDDEDGLIIEDRKKAEYEKYRAKYKEYRGVMPELDILHNPPVAVLIDDVIWPADIQKRSRKDSAKSLWNVTAGTVKLGAAFGAYLMSGGAIGGGTLEKGAAQIGTGLSKPSDPILAAELADRFQKIVDRYKYVYGLAFTGYGKGLKANGSVESITDSLGYSYDAQNGIYCEGTWQNNQLVFGVMSFDNVVFYGDYRDNFPSEGVLVNDDVVYCGVFNSDLELECEEGFAMNFENKMMWVGPFAGGQMDGMCIAYSMSEGVMKKYMYDYGKAKSGFAGLKAGFQAQKETSRRARERRKEACKEFFGKLMK